MARQLRFRGMTLPTTGSFTQKYPTIPALPGAAGRKELSGWSDCSLPLPADWSGLPSLLEGTLIKVIDGDKVIDESVAERMPYELRTGSTVTVEGPQIAGLTQRIGIYPPDFPFENPSKRPNWIWGGSNALPDLSLTALGHIQETWMFYLERERYGLKINDATEGQIVIRYDDESDAADPISFDPSASAIKSAVESLDGITE